jgi:DUF1680 family protein
MPVERMTPHPLIRQDAGQVALQRGPVVYCLEQVDNGSRLANITLPPDAPLTAAFDEDLLGGAAVIHGTAQRVEPGDWPGGLYQPRGVADLQREPFAFRAIPYFLWANRDPGEMRVWIREG